MNRNKADYMLTAKKRRKTSQTKTENVFVEGSECRKNEPMNEYVKRNSNGSKPYKQKEAIPYGKDEKQN